MSRRAAPSGARRSAAAPRALPVLTSRVLPSCCPPRALPEPSAGPPSPAASHPYTRHLPSTRPSQASTSAGAPYHRAACSSSPRSEATRSTVPFPPRRRPPSNNKLCPGYCPGYPRRELAPPFFLSLPGFGRKVGARQGKERDVLYIFAPPRPPRPPAHSTASQYTARPSTALPNIASPLAACCAHRSLLLRTRAAAPRAARSPCRNRSR